MKPKGCIIVKNWFGWPTHPTDAYINDKHKDSEEIKEKAEILRTAYDKIVAGGSKEELKTLLIAAQEKGI